jgi:hypothetical protein
MINYIRFCNFLIKDLVIVHILEIATGAKIYNPKDIKKHIQKTKNTIDL